MKTLCVYCGSNPGSLPEYRQAAWEFGSFLAHQGIHIVYGGGRVGLMGALATAALEGGGEVTGVIPEDLLNKELAHDGLTRLITTRSMHERKMKMARLSDGFVALPGGIGTMEEIFEVFTWTQLGFQAKPCGFLNVAGYYSPLFQFLDRMTSHRFLQTEHLDSLIREDDMTVLLRRLRQSFPAQVEKWIDEAEAGKSVPPRDLDRT